jgi:hypothetical protein
MNQGKIVVGVAVVLGICAGLAGYWWNYRIGHRALAFWGQENARLIRLAPKVEYLELAAFEKNTNLPKEEYFLVAGNGYGRILKRVDLSNARGLIHLRNAFLSDDQYEWEQKAGTPLEPPIHALLFTDTSGKQTAVYISKESPTIMLPRETELGYSETDYLVLGPLAKSLEQFLARELPRAEQEAAAGTSDKQPEPAKSE